MFALTILLTHAIAVNPPKVGFHVPWKIQDVERQKNRKSCDVCSKSDNYSICDICVQGQEDTCNELQILQCRHCRHMWMDKELTANELKEMYGPGYFYPEGSVEHIESEGQWGIPDHGEEEVSRRQRISKIQINEWKKYGILPSRYRNNFRSKDLFKFDLTEKKENADRKWLEGKNLQLVEIGGGAAYLSEAAKNAGMNVLNVEICRERAESAFERAGIPFFADFLDKGFQDGSVPKSKSLPQIVYKDESKSEVTSFSKKFADIVAMYDLLEHIPNPNEFIEDVKMVLKDGGKLAIRIPKTPVSGPSLHLYDHVNHFTEDSLNQFMVNHGFERVHSHYSGTFKCPKDPNGDRKIENMTAFFKLLPEDTSSSTSIRAKDDFQRLTKRLSGLLLL
jgi:2-polyprenyl-3-methyl-5-hydroxy-6-metoxy-1,4-benzoquinol methylase